MPDAFASFSAAEPIGTLTEQVETWMTCPPGLSLLFIIVIAVAERIYRDTCRKVQICFSVGVIQMNALAVVDHKREPLFIGVEHVLLGLFHILIRLHD